MAKRIIKILFLVTGLFFVGLSVYLISLSSKTNRIKKYGERVFAKVQEVNCEQEGQVTFSINGSLIIKYLDSECSLFKVRDSLQVFYSPKYPNEFAFINENDLTNSISICAVIGVVLIGVGIIIKIA